MPPIGAPPDVRSSARAPSVAQGLATLLALALTLGAQAAQAAPASGRYEATLCVNNGVQAPTCGPAAVDLRPGGRVNVQVSDIVYRVLVQPDRAAVVITQGSMQLDAFDAGADAGWSGSALHFTDPDKRVSYDVQIGRLRAAPK